MFKIKPLFTYFIKRYSSTAPKTLEHLSNRNLIRVSGPEADLFLQGLITNDIGHLTSKHASMYTMFLNTAGRVLFDSIIYRSNDDKSYLIECDSTLSQTLQKYLKLYRVRRKIDVVNVSNEMNVYALFNLPDLETFSDGNKEEDLIQADKDLLIYPDPRLPGLGTRIISRSDLKLNERIKDVVLGEDGAYRRLRYSLGVGEGVEDLPSGDCFPLECNCDYLHGVSFHKGCYIGQELTTRIYHTGVVRKRLMPIDFKKIPSKPPDAKIVHENVNLGRLRGIQGNCGLGLLRIEKALAFKEIQIGDGVGVPRKPSWWPVEETASAAKI